MEKGVAILGKKLHLLLFFLPIGGMAFISPYLWNFNISCFLKVEKSERALWPVFSSFLCGWHAVR